MLHLMLGKLHSFRVGEIEFGYFGPEWDMFLIMLSVGLK